MVVKTDNCEKKFYYPGEEVKGTIHIVNSVELNATNIEIDAEGKVYAKYFQATNQGGYNAKKKQ